MSWFMTFAVFSNNPSFELEKQKYKTRRKKRNLIYSMQQMIVVSAGNLKTFASVTVKIQNTN